MIAAFCSCVNEDYDLEKDIDMNVNVLKNVSVPIGSLEKVCLSDIIGFSEQDIVQTDDKGNLAIVFNDKENVISQKVTVPDFTFEDSYIVLQDSFSRLFLSRPAFYTSGVKVYSHIWKDMFTQIKDNFVFGMGADCIGMKMYGIPETLEIAGSADRAYNEYLNMAASTGVVSLVFYSGFVAGCLKRGVKGVSQFFNLKDNWTKTACFAGCVGYLACGVFSVSSVVSTPVFFTLLGLCFSKTEKD